MFCLLCGLISNAYSETDSKRREKIVWEKRFNIIEGITHGLIYLHHFSRLKVIHGDLKASNILLDNEMNPKISDFGMAVILDSEVVELKTKKNCWNIVSINFITN